MYYQIKYHSPHHSSTKTWLEYECKEVNSRAVISIWGSVCRLVPVVQASERLTLQTDTNRPNSIFFHDQHHRKWKYSIHLD